MTPEEERREDFAKRLSNINRTDSAMHAVKTVPPADDEPEDTK